MMIRIKYSCHGCGLTDVEVDVPTRGPEDVKAWIDQTLVFVKANHSRQSPTCPSGHVDLKIPFAGSDQRVGSPLAH